MNKNLLLPLLTAAIVLSGCDKKKEAPAAAPAPDAAPQAAPAAEPKSGYADALDRAKSTAAEVAAKAQQAGEQVVDRTTEQAKAAAESFKAELAATATKAVESAKSLLSNPQVAEPVKAELTKLLDGVVNNKDGVAAASLGKIVALKPSESQMAVVNELRSNLGVLVLGRNFDVNDPASGGVVKQTLDAIKSKDTAAIVTGLQKLGAEAKFTDAQKQMLGSLLGSYNGKLAGAVDSVNKAADALKGFGL